MESTDGIIECLTAMAVNGEERYVLEYTRKWICLVNHGGFFEIDDTVFEFIKAIEMEVRKKLLMAFDRNGDQDDLRESIVVDLTQLHVMTIYSFSGHFFQWI